MQSNLVSEVTLFPTPVWIYKFPEFDQYKEELFDYFNREDVWLGNEIRNNLVATRAELHKEPLLSPLFTFIQNSLEDAMGRMGYKKGIGITSAWATKHLNGGFHHYHTHRNSFLGAVFYLKSDDNRTQGTTFHNMTHPLYQIQPAVDPSKEFYFKSFDTCPFMAGSLLVFPAWLPHSTMPHEGEERVVVAVNAMPIGMTNSDHYDRYNYSDPTIMDLKQYAPIA